jgi:hypothetical protein
MFLHWVKRWYSLTSGHMTTATNLLHHKDVHHFETWSHHTYVNTTTFRDGREGVEINMDDGIA